MRRSRTSARPPRPRLPFAALILIPLLAWSLPPLLTAQSGLRDTVERYTLDRRALGRRYAVEYDPVRRARYRTFFGEWQQRLAINYLVTDTADGARVVRAQTVQVAVRPTDAARQAGELLFAMPACLTDRVTNYLAAHGTAEAIA